MKYNGRSVTMNTFVFSRPMAKAEDLHEWLEHFKKKGIFAFIYERADGCFVLVREGKERPTDMECEPVVGPCIHCGKEPPHALGHYRFCSDGCRDAEMLVQRRRHDHRS